MRAKVLSLAVLFMLSVGTVFAGEKTEKVKVKGGDCEECKTHIETTTKAVEGVVSADWDVETKELTVAFDDEKTTLENIEKALAKAGNDTPNFKATDEAYGQLPECCRYDREK